MWLSSKGWAGAGEACLVETLDIAAFKTWARGGLIPQVEQGGSCVCAFAVEASKLGGNALENEQIGQIHVAPLSFVGLGECGAVENELPDPAKDDVVGLRVPMCGDLLVAE